MSKNCRLTNLTGDAHLHCPSLWIGLNHRDDLSWQIADSAMKASFALLILLRSAHMRQAARRDEAAGEGVEPAGAGDSGWIWRHQAVVADPCQAVLLVEGIHDIHAPVWNHPEP